MPLTAKEVIQSARNRHPAFSPRATPDPVLRLFLADLQDELLAELAELKADAVHVAEEIELPLPDFDAGHTIATPYFRLHGGVAIQRRTGRPEELRVVEYVDRLERFSTPAVYDQAGTLFLLGDASDWEGYSQIVLDLFPSTPPEGEELASIESEFILPGRLAKSALVALTAAFLADRTDGLEAAKVAALHARASDARTAYLDEVSGRRRAKVSQIRSVW